MDIEVIRARVQSGNYLVKSHAVLHALKEGFAPEQMVDAVLNGMIIEAYPDEDRFLICGSVSLSGSAKIYLHVVCEYADPVYVEFVTAYIPDERQWESPPLRRRKRRK